MLKLLACGFSLWITLIASDAFSADVPDFTFDLKGDQLTLTPPDAHHFNTDAPMKIEAGKVSLKPIKSESKVTVRLSRMALKQPEVVASLYLCDNAKTYCVKKTEKFTLKSETGFVLNDADKAFALAKKQGLPVMIDFFGIWCPPCNHLDATVFHDPDFQKVAEGKIIRLKMDADRDSSKKLMDRYVIRGLPTTVFTAADGDELMRLVGEEDSKQMQKRVLDAYQNRDRGYAALVKSAKAGDVEAARRAAQIAIDNEDPATALDLLKGQPSSELGFKALAAQAKKNKDPKTEAKVLQDWLKAFPDSVDSVELYGDLVDLEDTLKDEAAKKQAIQGGLAATQKFLKLSPEQLSADHLLVADLKESLADFYDGLGEKDKAKTAYADCVAAYAAEGQAEKTVFPRGPNLERAYCLKKLGFYDETEAIYREGVKVYPDEFTFHLKLAGFLMEIRGDAEAAYPEVLEALKSAYGGQRTRTILLEGKVAESLSDRKAMAKAVKDLDDELKTSPNHKDELVEQKAKLEKKLKG
jgi:thiol-disulfide isomerase/thioredoxin